MKNKTKFLRTLVSLVLLMIAVFSFVNVSYSYFTSTTSNEGGISMWDLNVSFRYQQEEELAANIKKESSITLISATNVIERGVPFNLKIRDEDKEEYINIQSLSIINNDVSCDCYVRFWIEAYRVVEDVPDTSFDYGKYFFLTIPERLPQANNITRATSQPYCYYVEKAIKAGEVVSLSENKDTLKAELTLMDISSTDAVPIDLLGEKIEIRISFEAVQAANKAYLSAFKVTQEDAKGYYSKWT